MPGATIILRIAVFGTFFGHGMVALGGNPRWLPYLEIWGFNMDQAFTVMKIIGSIDLLVAMITLIRPSRYVLLYAIVWAFLTALVRPIAGESWWTFIERAANWAAPAALYTLLYLKNDLHSG